MDILWLLMDLLEVAIGLVGLAIAINKKKAVGYVILIAYWLYVLSDVLRIMNVGTSSLWDLLLKLAPIVALVALWMLYSEKKK